MPSPDDEPSTEPASTVSPARFAELEATVADLATFLRDKLSRDPQRPSGTDYEPRPSVPNAATKSASPADSPLAHAPSARPPPAAGDSRTWEEWAPFIAPGFAIHPPPGLSATPDFYDISTDENIMIMTKKRHWATLDKYRYSRYRFGCYDAASRHAALREAAAAIEGAAS
eukprot:jgi/Tetstr1/436301/TSEL_025141.t1